MTRDEEFTDTPESGSSWEHVESKKNYIVGEERKVKIDGRWYDTVDYTSSDDGKRYGRTVQDFNRNFRKNP